MLQPPTTTPQPPVLSQPNPTPPPRSVQQRRRSLPLQATVCLPAAAPSHLWSGGARRGSSRRQTTCTSSLVGVYIYLHVYTYKRIYGSHGLLVGRSYCYNQPFGVCFFPVVFSFQKPTQGAPLLTPPMVSREPFQAFDASQRPVFWFDLDLHPNFYHRVPPTPHSFPSSGTNNPSHWQSKTPAADHLGFSSKLHVLKRGDL